MRIITFLKLKLQRMLFNNNFSSIVILNLRFHIEIYIMFIKHIESPVSLNL